MFAKISRYRKLKDIAVADADGRTLESKEFRLPPDVSGTFLHSIEEKDRLDHLSFKYYKQPRKWWRICDANPGFMSPQALLGKEPVATVRFPLSFHDSGVLPPWPALIRNLRRRLGVEDVQPVEDIRLVEEEQTFGGKTVSVIKEHYDRAVVVTFNRKNVDAEDLADVITASGFGVAQPQNIGRIGKNIIIPPDVVG